MRVAALYDIHANLPALEAVLDEVRRAGADEVVVGGDVLPGPMPRETLAYLRSADLPVRFIHGNGDRAVLEEMRGVDTGALPEQAREAVRWTARQLDAGHERRLASWPDTLALDIPALGETLFCHATPRNDTEVFTRLTSEERLLPAFGGVSARLVICGHTHMQFDRRVGGVRVVNPGSVGMPFGEPGACWLLLGPGVELQRTPFDLERAAERIRATDYPRAAEFVEQHVLQRRSEQEMLEAFARVELK